MKRCYNCKKINRDSDKYCRNCGYMIRKSAYYIFINMGIILAFIGFILVVILFIASYYVY